MVVVMITAIMVAVMITVIMVAVMIIVIMVTFLVRLMTRMGDIETNLRVIIEINYD